MAKKNELRIVKNVNELGETIYNIERFYIWGKYMSGWFTEKSNIDTPEEALKIKNEIKHNILKNTIIEKNDL